MTSHFHILDWLVLLGYFTGTMGIGFYFYKKTRSPEGYTAANRSLPGWVCGLSIFATYLSSISYLALPGKSFAENWNPFVFSLSIPLVTWIAARYFLPYYRSSGAVSAYALLEQRFGLWARVYASVFYLLTQIARIAVVMYLMALPLQVIFGWDIYTILIVTGVSVTLYSFVGGIVAVIWTDAVQAIVLMAGALLCLVVMLARVPGGVGEVVTVAVEHNKFSLGSLGPSLRAPTFWVVLMYGLAINFQNFGIDQSYVQRYISSKSDTDARRSLWLGATLYVPVSALFFLIGTVLFAYYQADKYVPSIAPADAAVEQSASEAQPSSDLREVINVVARQRLIQQGVPVDSPDFTAKHARIANSLGLQDARKALEADGVTPDDPDYQRELVERTKQKTLGIIGDRVFPHFIATGLPPGMTGLLIAAVFAAAMSTVSTSLNSSATLLMSDYFKRFIRPQATERQSMFALYTGTVLWGVLGTGLSLGLVRLTESALDIWWILSGIFGGGMSGLFLLGMISRRARNPAAVSGVLVGVLTILWLSAPKLLEFMLKAPADSAIHGLASQLKASMRSWASPFHAFMVPVLGTLAILLVGILVSSVTGSKPKAR